MRPSGACAAVNQNELHRQSPILRWEHKTFSLDECFVRFHHQLVSKIHPFPNGNGRHARMMTDVFAVKHGQAEFTWGAGKDPVAEGDARTRYLAALRALDANENDVKLLLDFARS